MNRQEALLRRLLLGDDGSAERAKAQKQAHDQQEDDDKAMIYLAQEVSKQTLEQDQIRANKIILKEERQRQRAERAQLPPADAPPSAPAAGESAAKRKSDYDAQMEEAILQSLLESTKADAGHPHNRSVSDPPSRLQPVEAPRERPATARMPSQRNTGASLSHDAGLDDPAVVAFMEKRKQRQQQQKEEVLARSMAQEAQRLAAIGAADPSAAPLPAPAAVATPSPSLTMNDLDSPPARTPLSAPVSAPAPVPARRPSDAAAYAPSPTIPYAPSPGQPVAAPLPAHSPSPMPMAEYDPTHVLHPDNATAMKAATALLQLARRATKGVIESELVSRDSAAMQMASIWLTQAAHHWSKQRETNGTQSQPSPAPALQHHHQQQPQQQPQNLFPPSLPQIQHLHIPAPHSALDSAHRTPRALEAQRAELLRSNSSRHVSPKVEADWSCPVCTLLNSATCIKCDACGMPKGNV